MHDELGHGDIKPTVVERQLFRTRLAHVDTGVALPVGSDERARRVDGAHRTGAKASDEPGRQRSRPTSDIERRLPGTDVRQLQNLRHELRGVTAHEAVVGISRDFEEHESTVRSERSQQGDRPTRHHDS